MGMIDLVKKAEDMVLLPIVLLAKSGGGYGNDSATTESQLFGDLNREAATTTSTKANNDILSKFFISLSPLLC